MSPKTEEEIGAEFRRVMHMQTMEEMAQELEKLNLSTEGSQRELHQRLLRFHLNESFSDIVHLPISLCFGTRSQISFKLINDKASFNRVTVSNEGKTIHVNMKPTDQREQSTVGKAECETCKIYFQNSTDTNTEGQKIESNDKELTDYQLSCLNLLRAWILCNPYMKDERPKDFLGNLTDLRKIAKMDDEMLLKMLPCVLWPSIKSWYRTKNFNSWQEFELSFLEEYGSNPIDLPKSSDASAETTVSAQVATNTEASRSDRVNDGVADKVSASQSSHQEKQADKTDQESRWECISKLRLLGLRFSGQRGLAAMMFMDDLNDFRSYGGVNDRVLLDVLPSILDNDTKIWYRANKFALWHVFETNFIAGFKFIPNRVIQSKPAIMTAVPQRIHYNANNSSNPNNLFTINKNSMNSYPLTIQKPSIPNQPNYVNNSVPSTHVSSQRPIVSSYSANASSNCTLPNCPVGSGHHNTLPLSSQPNYSSIQPSYASIGPLLHSLSP